MRAWSEIHPDTIESITQARRVNARNSYKQRRKVQRCERLLIAAHYLILELLPYHAPMSHSDGQLLNDIEEEIGHR